MASAKIVQDPESVSYLNKREAAEIDEILMELAGLSVAASIAEFQKWFDDAMASGLKEPNAMALSTTRKDGKPSSRMVLLKGRDKDGFVWYTNYGSQKAHQISENPHAALLFYWDALNHQVRIKGSVQRVSDEESEQYFHSRPRGSQIGAIVSKQSTVISGRQFLHQQQEDLEAQFSNGSLIPKPKYWGGYRLKPELFEFWQGQPSRLHDRLYFPNLQPVCPFDHEKLQPWEHLQVQKDQTGIGMHLHPP